MKEGGVFPFLILTTSAGSLLMVKVDNADEKTSTGWQRRFTLSLKRRQKSPKSEPIYSVVGDEFGLVYCTGNVLQYEVLDDQVKEMKQTKRFMLDSPAITLQISNGKLIVLTASHSLLIMDYKAKDALGDIMGLLHTDTSSRTTTHMVQMGVSTVEKPQSTITMISDASSNLVGTWIPWGRDGQPMETVFEANLAATVRRFVLARCRPQWTGTQKYWQYGTLPSREDGADVFGVSLDGTLQHFTLLSVELWHFLNIIEFLARRSPDVASFIPANGGQSEEVRFEQEALPSRMHINGDVVVRCLQRRSLEKLVEDENMEDKFRASLDAVEAGAYTQGFRDGERTRDRYFKLAYEILAFLNEPVL